ncbi:hypothetical protein DB346_08275 [Verrucomicrobia bacterium LW23]|nr:hypothetical protein DB346_08275 [Verrucomicrobia bacterium LW23]
MIGIKNPAEMSPAERGIEIATILARGFLDLQVRKAQAQTIDDLELKSAPLTESCLELCGHSSPHGVVHLNQETTL